MKSVDAKQLLDNEIFQYAMEQWKESCIHMILENPTDCLEANIGLAMREDLIRFIESLVFDEKLAAYNRDQVRKYQ